MKNLYSNIFKTILFALLSVVTLNAQNTITVDNTPQSTTTHTTIQAAIDAATAGDIIFVQPSAVSYGAATINKALTIIGRSHSEPNNISTVSTMNIRASNVTLKGLNLSSVSAYSTVSQTPITDVNIFECKTGGIGIGGITNNRTDMRISGMNVNGCVINGITSYNEVENVVISNSVITSTLSIYSPSTFLLEGNVFRFSSSMNINNYGLIGETLNISNSMFLVNSSSDRTVNLTGNDHNITNSLTYNFGTGNLNFVASNSVLYQNNMLLNTDPLFTNIGSTISTSMAGTGSYNPSIRLEDDLTLQVGPALTGGTAGAEIGLFRYGFNYKYLGNPRGIPTLDIVNYEGTVAKDGNINVTIKAKAH